LVRAAWYEFSTIAFSDSATAIKSEGKNFYASMATPGGTAPATSTFEVGKWGGAASFGLTAQASRNGRWQFSYENYACQLPTTGCWEDTGFVQQDFIDYANQLIPGVHNGVAVRKYPSTKMQATNDDCDHWGNLGHGDEDEVMCVLVFPDHTGTITVDKYQQNNPQKPAFAILAPQATVVVADGAGRVHGAIVAYDIDIKDAGAQMHGWWIGPDNYSNDGDDLPCSCEGD
jgi:hypothetical protein